MFRTLVSRKQHAVGHGGFHTGYIEIRAPAKSGNPRPDGQTFQKFWYVYDCGSEQSAALNSALATYRSSCQGRTDILFISHLHSDHINGIERLQAQAPAKTVVVPYLDVFERLLFMLSDIGAGTASSSAREYFEDPTSWWERRGARQVIFLQAAQDRDEPPGAPEVPGTPDAPIDGGEPPLTEKAETRTEKMPDARFSSHLRAPEGEIPIGLISARDWIRDMPSGAYLAGAGSSFQLEWRPDAGDGWRIGDWLLLPYVHPADENTRSQFRRAVMKALKVRVRDEIKLTQELLNHLSSYAGTKVLLELYADHFGAGHNALSMSLYSGPSCERNLDPQNDDDWRRMWRINWAQSSGVPFVRWPRPCGWLGTGDAALKQTRRRLPWLKFFKPFVSDVLVMTLPHHGSAHNFHEDILAFDQMQVALATTVEDRQRVSRMRETLDLVQAHGISTEVVDEKHHNGFSIHCERSMAW